MTPAVVIILGLVVCAAAVAAAIYTINLAHEAVDEARAARNSARAAQVAAERAARHVDGLIELLADLSPSARRASLAARTAALRSPATGLAQRQLARQHGYRIDEGTT